MAKKQEEYILRNSIMSWIEDSAEITFGPFDGSYETEVSGNSSITTFKIILSGTPSAFTEDGDQLEVSSDSDGHPLIQKKTVRDGRELAVFIEAVEFGKAQSVGFVHFFAYYKIDIPSHAYHKACDIANQANVNSKYGVMQVLKQDSDDRLTVRVKASSVVNQEVGSEVLDQTAYACLYLAYETWSKFKMLER